MHRHNPVWKVYMRGEYVAAFVYAEDAALFLGTAGSSGDTIKFRHSKIVWREGHEELHASESYDRTAQIMRERMHQYVHTLSTRRRGGYDY